MLFAYQNSASIIISLQRASIAEACNSGNYTQKIILSHDKTAESNGIQTFQRCTKGNTIEYKPFAAKSDSCRVLIEMVRNVQEGSFHKNRKQSPFQLFQQRTRLQYLSLHQVPVQHLCLVPASIT